MLMYEQSEDILSETRLETKLKERSRMRSKSVVERLKGLMGLCKSVADENYIENALGEPKEDSIGMLELERNELIRRTRAMTREDMEIVVAEIPIDICINRVVREIKELHEFKRGITGEVERSKREEV